MSPPRSPNGYRVYDDTDIERLAFITRAKRLDISLDDVRGLLVARESDQCATVQGNMAVLVAARLKEAEHRIAELTGLAEQLRSVQNRLRAEPATGRATSSAPAALRTRLG